MMIGYLQPGQAAVVEHKTASGDIGEGSPYWRKLVLDSQVSNYHAAAQALGVEPVGIVYDVVRKVALEPYLATPAEDREYTQPKSKACPVCKKKSAPPAPHTVDGLTCEEGRIVTDPGGRLYKNQREFDETLDEYRLRVRQEIGTNIDKYFRRGLIVRNEAERRESAYDVWMVGQQIRESQLANAWPRNTDACTQYNSTCDYWPVCAGEASIEDPTRYEHTAAQHEELGGATADNGATASDGRVHLPLLTTSSAKAYRSCPRRYYFAYETRMRPVRKSQALRFGTLFHRGLEVWWSTVDFARAIEVMRGAGDLDIDPVDLIRAEELMLGYHVRWRGEHIDVLAVEREFRAPLINPATGKPSRTWQRAGKMDAVMRAREAEVESTAAEESPPVADADPASAAAEE